MIKRREIQALDVLQRIDVTSKALARITGMPPKTASSVLSQFFRLGVVTRERRGMDVTGRPPYLYSIKRAA